MKHYKAPRALICGMLEKDGKALFLVKKGADGTARIEMPWIYGTLAGDPVGALGEAFRKQTSVKVHAERIVMEGKEDIGEPGMPDIVPVLVFVVVADRSPMEEPYPAKGFDACIWLSMDEARQRPLGPHARWLTGQIIGV